MARLRRPSRTQSAVDATGAKATSSRALRPRQTSPMRISRQRMKEDSSGDSDDSDDADDTDPLELSDNEFGSPSAEPQRRLSSRNGRPRDSPSKRTTSTPSKRTNEKPQGRSSASRASKRRAPISRSDTPTKKPKVDAGLPVRQGRIPPWTDPRIPYEAWVAIFSYASIDSSNGWLVDCSTVCKTFLEPALTALYRQPTPATVAKLKRLVELVKRDPSETTFNYRSKIESMSLDIKHTPANVYFPLIHPLARLKDLFIVTSLDRPPYRSLDGSLRWTYPKGIFSALDAGSDPSTNGITSDRPGTPVAADDDPSELVVSPTKRYNLPEDRLTIEEKPHATRLRSWEWSGRMIGGHVPSIYELASMHQKPYFQGLTTLSFTNFQTPSMLRLASSSAARLEAEGAETDVEAAQAIAAAISELRALRHLVFEASTIVDHVLLPLLPTTLRQLTLINCWEVRSDIFASFLHTHGRQLYSLTLSHCQSLNLEFLTSLGAACPNLRDLSMDLSYFRLHNSVNDSDPMYDYVLLPDQIPDWPSSIRYINMDNVKDCPADTAKMFLHSLLDNAERLKDLRYVAIKMMLNIPWQERAQMRNDWRQKMEDVFLRKSDPPVNWGSNETKFDVEDGSASRKRKSQRRSSPSRRSGRLSTKGRGSRTASERLRQKDGRLDYRDPDTDHDDVSSTDEEASSRSSSSASGGGDDGAERPVQYIQGMCNTVSILFDNKKPMEMQYGMEDFHDEEADSGEEWDGDDDDEDDTIFVWR